MDILKHGADVKVLAPKALRTKIMEEIREMSKSYD